MDQLPEYTKEIIDYMLSGSLDSVQLSVRLDVPCEKLTPSWEYLLKYNIITKTDDKVYEDPFLIPYKIKT